MAYFEQSKASKLWSVRFRFVEFGECKNKRLSGFKTKKDADKAYTDFMATHQLHSKSDNSKTLFSELYKNYLRYAKERVKGSSLYDIENVFPLHILPYFGEKKAFRITKTDIYDWQEMLNKKEYSFSYKKKMRSYLSSVFRYAVYYFNLPVNPVEQVEPFKNKEIRQEMLVWDKEDFSKFIAEVDDTIYKTFFSFLYLTGCRKGEAFALTWDKIDFKKCTVLINVNLTRKCKGKPYEIVPTKTYAIRRIAFPKSLLELLNGLPRTGEFVFGGSSPLSENTASRRFAQYIKKAKVTEIHIHCLRHSHASYLLNENQSIVMVSKRLGHASIEQTLNTYAHLMPNEEQKLIESLDFKI